MGNPSSPHPRRSAPRNTGGGSKTLPELEGVGSSKTLLKEAEEHHSPKDGTATSPSTSTSTSTVISTSTVLDENSKLSIKERSSLEEEGSEVDSLSTDLGTKRKGKRTINERSPGVPHGWDSSEEEKERDLQIRKKSKENTSPIGKLNLQEKHKGKELGKNIEVQMTADPKPADCVGVAELKNVVVELEPIKTHASSKEFKSGWEESDSDRTDSPTAIDLCEGSESFSIETNAENKKYPERARRKFIYCLTEDESEEDMSDAERIINPKSGKEKAEPSSKAKKAVSQTTLHALIKERATEEQPTSQVDGGEQESYRKTTKNKINPPDRASRRTKRDNKKKTDKLKDMESETKDDKDTIETLVKQAKKVERFIVDSYNPKAEIKKATIRLGTMARKIEACKKEEEKNIASYQKKEYEELQKKCKEQEEQITKLNREISIQKELHEEMLSNTDVKKYVALLKKSEEQEEAIAKLKREAKEQKKRHEGWKKNTEDEISKLKGTVIRLERTIADLKSGSGTKARENRDATIKLIDEKVKKEEKTEEDIKEIMQLDWAPENFHTTKLSSIKERGEATTIYIIDKNWENDKTEELEKICKEDKTFREAIKEKTNINEQNLTRIEETRFLKIGGKINGEQSKKISYIIKIDDSNDNSETYSCYKDVIKIKEENQTETLGRDFIVYDTTNQPLMNRKLLEYVFGSGTSEY
ncbi:hypothetical protein ABEB36_009313 [Hypothenemus hampei]|uniref:Uncharacterized protein n=1 Tax=Hypothenemus hampei TaxID=57062 RepID=A0ABD1EI26_HYPHA